MQRRNFFTTILGTLGISHAATGPRTRPHPSPDDPNLVINPLTKGDLARMARPTSPSDVDFDEWLEMPMQPINDIDDHGFHPTDRPKAEVILRHIHESTPMKIRYGANPDTRETRKIHPILLFTKIDYPLMLAEARYHAYSAGAVIQPNGEPAHILTDMPDEHERIPYRYTYDPIYLMAYCKQCQNSRTFRLDRLELTTSDHQGQRPHSP